MIDNVFIYSIAVFLTSLAISFISIGIQQRIISREQISEWQREINAWNEERKIAAKLGDKKLLAKLKRREKRILQIQSKMFKKQMTVFLINLTVFIGVWQVLIFYLGNKTVAYLPFSIPFIIGSPPYPLNLFYWYVICSMTSTTIVSRILGVPMGFGVQTRTK